MLTKDQIRRISKTFLGIRLATVPGTFSYITAPERLEPFIYAAYEKHLALVKEEWLKAPEEAERWVQDQCEKWANRKLDNLLNKTLESRL